MTTGYKVLRDTWRYDWGMLVEAAPELAHYLEDVQNTRQENVSMPGNRPYNNTTLRAAGLNEDELALAEMVSNQDMSKPVETNIEEISIDRAYDHGTSEFHYRFENDNRFKGVGDPGVPLLPIPRCFLAERSEVWSGENIKYKFHGHRGHACDARKDRFSHRGKFLRLVHASYYFDRKKNFMSEKREHFKCISFNLETNKLYYIRYETKKIRNKRLNKILNRNIRRLECRNATPAFLGVTPDSVEMMGKFAKALLKDTKASMPGVFVPSRDNVTKALIQWPFNRRMIKEIEYLKYLISALILQRRVGQPLQWVQDIGVLQIVYGLWDFSSLYELLTNGAPVNPGTLKHDTKKYKCKYMYRVHSNLKKKPTLKRFFETILGHFTTKSIISYLMLSCCIKGNNNNSLIDPVMSAVRISSLLTGGILPTETMHLLKRVVNDVFSIQNARSILASNGLLSFINDIYPAMQDDRILDRAHAILTDIGNIYMHNYTGGKVDNHTMESFIKLLQRLWVGEKALTNVRWTTWRDAFRMAEQLNLRIRPNKFVDFDGVQSLHDQLTAIHRRDTASRSDLGHIYFLPCFCPQEEFDGFRFVQLTHISDLIAEGTAMHHCVGGYGYNCTSGYSIIFSMWKDRSYVTIELNGKTLEIAQKYTINDNSVDNPEILNIIDRWHKRLLHMHRKDKETYIDVARRFHKYQLAAGRSMPADIDGVEDMRAKLSKEFDGLKVSKSGLYGEHGIASEFIERAPNAEVQKVPQPEEEPDLFLARLEQRLAELSAANG